MSTPCNKTTDKAAREPCPRCGGQMRPIAVPANMVGGFVCENHCEEITLWNAIRDAFVDAHVWRMWRWWFLPMLLLAGCIALAQIAWLVWWKL